MPTTETKPGADVDIVARRKEIIRRPPRIARWIGRAALVGYLFALWWYRAWIGEHLQATSDVVWSFDSRAAFLSALEQFTIAAAAETLKFFMIGLLVLWAAGKPRSDRSSFRRKCFLLILGLGMTTTVRGLEFGGMPGGDQLWIPVIGCLAGMTVGSASLRGKKGIMRLCAWTFTHLLLFCVFLLFVGYLATDDQPLDVQQVTVTAAEKRRLMDMIKQAVHQRSADGSNDTRQLRLSESEVKTLFAWGMEAAGTDPRVDLRLEPETVTVQASPSFTIPLVGKRFVNAHLAAQVDVTEGHPELRVEELQLGRLGCPQSACDYVSRAILSGLQFDDDISDIVKSIERLQVDEAEVTLVGNRTAIREKVLPAIQSKLGMSRQLIAATSDHLKHIVSTAGNLPQGDSRFVAIATEAFRFAQQRSTDADPVLENQAALLSLGIVLGHRRVADLAGSPDAARQWYIAQKKLGSVTIRGRGDWTQHFCVSGALVVMADKTTSDMIGVLKEELDSGGGSGFSFGDLLADRAGTMLGESATRNEASARKLQERFAGGVTIDDIFPPAADLPEGLQEAELQSLFGGIDGVKYREITQEIERRLQQCYLLQP